MEETLYQIYEKKGRNAVEERAVCMFPNDHAAKVFEFAILGHHTQWAQECAQKFTQEDKEQVGEQALSLACLVGHEEMCDEILSWNTVTPQQLPSLVLFLAKSNAPRGPQILQKLFDALATSDTNLDDALVLACATDGTHQQEMVEGISLFANPFAHQKLAVLHAIQNTSAAAFNGLMMRWRTQPNALAQILTLPLNTHCKAIVQQRWNAAKNGAPLWEKNRLQESIPELPRPQTLAKKM